MAKKCLIILGMHRSGTSVLTGVLNLLGVDLGKSVSLEGGEDNPKGIFENGRIVRLNNVVLQKLKMRWDKVHRLDWWDTNHLNDLSLEVAEIFAEDFDNKELIGFKDPRTCITLPFWQKHMTGYEVMYVLIIRKPMEVALSLKKRNSFSYQKSLNLWYEYNISAIEHIRKCKNYLIRYDDFMNNTKEVLTELSKSLGLDFTNYDAIENTIDEFIIPRLRHYKLSDEENRRKSLIWGILSNDKVFRFWNYINKACPPIDKIY